MESGLVVKAAAATRTATTARGEDWEGQKAGGGMQKRGIGRRGRIFLTAKNANRRERGREGLEIPHLRFQRKEGAAYAEVATTVQVSGLNDSGATVDGGDWRLEI